MFKGIEHFAIASRNPKQLVAFYVSYLEFATTYEYAGNYFIQAPDGALIEVIPAEGDAPINEMRTPGIRHIALAVDDFDAAYTKLRAQGIKFEGKPYNNEGNRLVFFRDPEGNLLHLIQRAKPLR